MLKEVSKKIGRLVLIIIKLNIWQRQHQRGMALEEVVELIGVEEDVLPLGELAEVLAGVLVVIGDK